MNEDYKRLIELKETYPKLTFQNEGYEYISKEIQEEHKEQINEISEILKRNIEGFVKFNNFKDRKDRSFDIRVQYNWDERFVGVGYFNIEDFNNEVEHE